MPGLAESSIIYMKQMPEHLLDRYSNEFHLYKFYFVHTTYVGIHSCMSR